MITWNGNFFHFPGNSLIEIVTAIHDYVIIFLFSISFIVVLRIMFRAIFSNFRIEFFERHELERVWTLLPFLLLIFIVLPSISVLYNLDTCLFCGICINIVGHQWYWSYIIEDLGQEMEFDSYIIPSDIGVLRLIDVDNRLRIPCGVPSRFLITSADVIHSWTLPSFGVKADAIPGRINQLCISRKRSGIFFGQCSEICGANHRFMPIVLEIYPYKNIF